MAKGKLSVTKKLAPPKKVEAKNAGRETSKEELEEFNDENLKEFKELLDYNHNIILHGAPGTGKTYLAKKIATAMGCSGDEIGFVQFHQSYDYTDFVEGLRPVNQDKGQIGFERKDGIFKVFCKKALLKFHGNVKPNNQTKTASVRELAEQFISDVLSRGPERKFLTERNKRFYLQTKYYKNKSKGVNDLEAVNETAKKPIPLKKDLLCDILCDPRKYDKVMDLRAEYFNGRTSDQASYYNSLRIAFKEEFRNKGLKKETSNSKTSNNFVFIIDEINRGEMSKIFGELFFSIDPGYRGIKGKIRTQYANLQKTPNAFDKALNITETDANKDNYGYFFVPENVYIIGTMNDIDRSVDSMDFAMRRRFAFKEITAKDRVEMLNELGDNREKAVERMKNLNEAIEKIPGLSAAYHIGPAYFLKLKKYENDFDKLWEYHIEGVVKEYLRGMDSANEKLKNLAKAFGYSKIESRYS